MHSLHVYSFADTFKTFNQYQKYMYTALNTMFLSLINIIITFMLMYVTECEQKKNRRICDKQNGISNCEPRFPFRFTEGDNFSLEHNEKLPFSLSVRIYLYQYG